MEVSINRIRERDIMPRKVISDKDLPSDYGKKIKSANKTVIVSDSILRNE